MQSYVQFLLEMLRQFFGGFWNAISGFFGGLIEVVNVLDYFDSLDKYKGDFNGIAWVVAIITVLLLIAVLVAIIMLVALFIRRRIRAHRAMENQMALIDEVGKLNAQVIRLTKEKDRILAIKAGARDLPHQEGASFSTADEEENTSALKEGESRFYKLTQVDAQYAEYDRESEVFDNEITLEGIVVLE